MIDFLPIPSAIAWGGAGNAISSNDARGSRRPRGRRELPWRRGLFDGQRLLDQLGATGNFGEQLVGALLSHGELSVVIGLGHLDHLDAGLLVDVEIGRANV